MRSSVTTRSGRGMVALVAASLVAAGCGSPQAINDDGAGNDGDTTPGWTSPPTAPARWTAARSR